MYRKTSPATSILCLVLLLSAGPCVRAGTETDPDVVDARGDAFPPAANAWADVLSGWVEAAPADHLTFSLRMASLDVLPQDAAYVFVFDADGRSYYAVMAVYALDVLYFAGEFDRSTGMPLDSHQVTGSHSRSEALVHVEVPRSMYPNSTRLDEPEILSMDSKPFLAGSGGIVWDHARGEHAIELASPMDAALQADEPARDPLQVPLPAPALLLLLGALAAWLLRRRP